jgi:hypothetical protein
MEIRKLKANEIEVKVKKVTGKGCLLLLYKTARTDMQLLDETFGPMNWQCDYKTINGVLYCGIGVARNDNGQTTWVWKWDCGIESRSDEDGNEKKGEASDAFKRAGFKIGIGRELYTAPFIWANLPTKNIGKETEKWVLVNPFQKFIVDTIEYNKEGEISHLVIVDEKGNKIYSGRKQ